jgi:hypothetical protein
VQLDMDAARGGAVLRSGLLSLAATGDCGACAGARVLLLHFDSVALRARNIRQGARCILSVIGEWCRGLVPTAGALAFRGEFSVPFGRGLI